MAYFEDLKPCRYGFPEAKDTLLAVGWLENGRPFRTGRVSKMFKEHLGGLLNAPWAPIDFMCDLCPPGGKYGGCGEVFVHAQDAVFVAPGLICSTTSTGHLTDLSKR